MNGSAIPQTTSAPLALRAIPTEIAKEWVSIAYVRAIAAQVGLNIKRNDWDDGIDLEVGSTKPVTPGFPFRNLWISLQLKATAQWEVREDTIAFFLKQSNYEQLRQASMTRQYLVLYTLPVDCSRTWWIRQRPDHVDLLGRAFYFDLRDAPPLPQRNGRAQCGRTVYVPVQNRLTAGSLRRLYLDAIEAARAMVRS